jgi:hypothetical protein
VARGARVPPAYITPKFSQNVIIIRKKRKERGERRRE